MTHWLRGRWPLLVLLLTASIWFYRSPQSAADLEIVPDSEEYAIGALELLDTGHFHIVVEGRRLPPRYPPWFSAIALLPSFALFGENPGNAVLPVMALAVAGIGCVWPIGRRVAGTAGAIFACLAVLVIPSYSIRAGQIMTDVPCTAILLAVCVLYLRARERPRALAPFLAAGFLIAVAALFRTLFGALLLPFLYAAVRSREGLLRRFVTLLAPVALAASATLLYNASTFGSPLRNGYHLWTPVPSDYLWLTFSLSNIPPNLTMLWNSPLPVLLGIALIALAVLRFGKIPLQPASRDSLLEVITFFALTAGPLVAIHLLYFYRNDRFFLALFAGTAVVAGTTAALALGRRADRIAKWLVVPALCLAVFGRFTTPDATPYRWLAAERIRQSTPPNATIISAIDPVYLERLAARGSERRIVPLSRNVEYASKVLAWKRVADPQPPPRNARDADQDALLRGGAQPAVQFVASEHVDEIAEEVARGVPVYIDTTMAGPSDNDILSRFSQRCRFRQRGRYLFEAVAR